MAAPRLWTERWIARYGDPVMIPTISGDVMMTADPSLTKELLRTDPTTFDPFAIDVLAPLLGEHSMFLLSGEEHRRERKLMLPAFHGAHLRSYGHTMQGVARAQLSAVANQKEVRMRDVAQAISIEIIVRTVFGVQERERVAEFTRTVTDLIDSAGSLVFFFPSLQRSFWGLGPYARLRHYWNQTNDLLQEQIDRTRARGTGDDMLTLLLQARFDDGSAMTDEHIKDELRTLLLAGHETTATALSWAVDAVQRNPGVRRRLSEELEASENTDDPVADTRMTYLDAVVKETLRHYPPVTDILRTLVRPLAVGGYSLPGGHSVGVSIASIHHRADLYPDPEVYAPDRFLDRRFGPHEYLPYGGGNRRCIGAAFADFELRAVLATAFREFSFTLLEADTPKAVRRNLTFGPKGGVPVHISVRDPSRRRRKVEDAHDQSIHDAFDHHGRGRLEPSNGPYTE